MELDKVLKLYMEKHQLNPSELARLTGIGQPVIFRMVSGETGNPKVATLNPIANYFGITINQLIGDEPLPSDFDSPLAKDAAVWRRVPHLTWSQVADFVDEKPQSHTSYIQTNIRASDNAYAVTLQDDSMQPKFPARTVLVIDKSLKPETRDFAVVRFDDQINLRQVIFDDKGVYLKPLNAAFDVAFIENSKTPEFLGVLLESRMQFKR